MSLERREYFMWLLVFDQYDGPSAYVLFERFPTRMQVGDFYHEKVEFDRNFDRITPQNIHDGYDDLTLPSKYFTHMFSEWGLSMSLIQIEVRKCAG